MSSSTTSHVGSGLGELWALENAYIVKPSGDLTQRPGTVIYSERTGRIVDVHVEDGEEDQEVFQHPIYDDANANARAHARRPSVSICDAYGIPVDRRVDLGGQILSPGLIDVQINGCFGVDYSEWKGDKESYLADVKKSAIGLTQTGVTSFVPTVISQTPEAYHHIVTLLDPTETPAINDYPIASSSKPASSSLTNGLSSSNTVGADVLGYHLEGPFLSPEKPGCHPRSNIREAPNGFQSFKEVYGDAITRRKTGPDGVECVKIVTLAPEVPGVRASVKQLAKEGWIVSVGHSAASTGESLQAIVDGATMITHLYNAMPQLHHREPGILGLLGLPSHLPLAHPQPTAPLSRSSSLRSSPPARTIHPGFAKHLSQTVQSVISSPVQTPTEHFTSSSKLSNGVAVDGRASRSSTVSSDNEPITPLELPDHHRAEDAPHHKPNGVSQFGASPESTPRSAGVSGTSLTQQLDEILAKNNGNDEGEVAVKRPFYSIIADGVHVHPQAVNFAYKAHEEGCVLITDTVSLMDPNLPDGTYPWRDGHSSIIKNGSSITLEGTSTLAGACVSLDECVRNFAVFTSSPLSKAISCASTNAARALGGEIEHRKGAIRVGMDADLVVWDRNQGTVLKTIVRGKQAFARS